MKKIASIASLLLLVSFFAACGNKNSNKADEGATDTIGAVVKPMADTVQLPADAQGYMVYSDKQQSRTNFDGEKTRKMAYVLPGKNLMILFNTIMLTKKGSLYEVEVHVWNPDEKGTTLDCATLKIGRMKSTVTSDFAFADLPKDYPLARYMLVQQGDGTPKSYVSKEKVNGKYLHFKESPEVRLIIEDILRQPNYAELRAFVDSYWV